MVQRFDDLMSPEFCARLRDGVEAIGELGQYERGAVERGLGQGMFQRPDVIRDFFRTGGPSRRRVEPLRLFDRTNFFRADLITADQVHHEELAPFLDLEALKAGARRLYGRAHVVPTVAYLNVMLSGQELAVHTDVPEFTGMSRADNPEWLLVAMHHSGLFEAERNHIATAVCWIHPCEGGELSIWPEGSAGERSDVPVSTGSAVLMDTDTVYHGVQVVDAQAERPPLKPGDRLQTVKGAERPWRLLREGEELAEFGWSELRVSLSWKAYCFDSEDDHVRWQEGSGLTQDSALNTLLRDLRSRGHRTKGMSDAAFADALFDEYLDFPEPS